MDNSQLGGGGGKGWWVDGEGVVGGWGRGGGWMGKGWWVDGEGVVGGWGRGGWMVTTTCWPEVVGTSIKHQLD